MGHLFRNLGIRAQLTILLLMVLAPFLIFEGYEIRDKFNTLYAHEVQANLEMARATRTMFASYVNSVLRAEAAILVDFTAHGYATDEIARVMAAVRAQGGYLGKLMWLSPEGRVLASNVPGAVGLDASDRPYFQELARGPQDWGIGDLVLGRATGQPSFSINRAARDGAGTLRGVLVAIIDEDALRDELSFERGTSAAISLVDRTGMLVFRNPPVEMTWEERDWLKTYPAYREVFDGREFVGTVVAHYDGKPRVVALVPLPFGWAAGAGRSESEVIGSVFAQIRTGLFVLGFLVTAGLAAAALLARQIVRSVASVREQADAVARGDYIPRTAVAETKEFRSLTGALEAMSDRVREREAALRESEARLSALIEQLPVGVGVVDAGGEFVISNAVLKRFAPRTLVAHDPERRARWKTFDRQGHEFPPDQWPGPRALRGETVSPGMEFEHADADGSTRWVTVSAVPFSLDGRTAGAVLVYQDVTERRHAEQELRRLNEQLEGLVNERTAALEEKTHQLRRLAGELTLIEQRERRNLSRILHDGLQQYLVAAKMQIEGLASEHTLSDARAAAADAQQLLAEAIRVSRTLAAELSPPVLRDSGILAGLEWLSRWMLEKHGLKVQLAIAMDAPAVSEDVKVLLFESVREMLLNVVKHAGTRSATVTLSRRGAGQLTITVSDDGRGFDVGESREVSTATGFGLFSIQERITLIGGSFKVESRAGEGTRITISAPTDSEGVMSKPAPPAAKLALAPRPSAPEANAGKIRILIADDHVVMREGLARLLSQQPDFEIVGEASNGQEAVEQAGALLPDLILMDISMPVLNGIEATRIIHLRHPGIKLIGLSLYTEDESARQMTEAGASFYMSKSGATADLIGTIRSCCQRG